MKLNKLKNANKLAGRPTAPGSRSADNLRPMNTSTDTIVAPATASGGAIAVIRISGRRSHRLSATASSGAGKPLAEAAGLHPALRRSQSTGDSMIDDVARGHLSVHRTPTRAKMPSSYRVTARSYIVSEIIALLLRCRRSYGATGRIHHSGLTSQAGKLDLAQAEAVADHDRLVDSRASHAHGLDPDAGRIFRRHWVRCATNCCNLASLLELELDFSEEDVQFADRATPAGDDAPHRKRNRPA